MSKYSRNSKEVKNACERLLTALYGPDWDTDPNFTDTANRMSRSFGELLEYENDLTRETALQNIFSKTFPCKIDCMIFAPNITVFSVCPHHMLPVRYNITIGYIPVMKEKVIGASKLFRLAEVLAKRAILQEDLGQEIMETLDRKLQTNGVAVVISGIHDCMTVRGIKNNGTFETSHMLGAFKENESTRAEFFNLLANATRRSL